MVISTATVCDLTFDGRSVTARVARDAFDHLIRPTVSDPEETAGVEVCE